MQTTSKAPQVHSVPLAPEHDAQKVMVEQSIFLVEAAFAWEKKPLSLIFFLAKRPTKIRKNHQRVLKYPTFLDFPTVPTKIKKSSLKGPQALSGKAENGPNHLI